MSKIKFVKSDVVKISQGSHNTCTVVCAIVIMIYRFNDKFNNFIQENIFYKKTKDGVLRKIDHTTLLSSYWYVVKTYLGDITIQIKPSNFTKFNNHTMGIITLLEIMFVRYISKSSEMSYITNEEKRILDTLLVSRDSLDTMMRMIGYDVTYGESKKKSTLRVSQQKISDITDSEYGVVVVKNKLRHNNVLSQICSFCRIGENNYISDHAYAILDSKLINGSYYCLLFNPWGNTEPQYKLSTKFFSFNNKTNDGLFVVSTETLSTISYFGIYDTYKKI